MSEIEIKKTYYPNGQIESEGEFLNGVPHGRRHRWYENSILAFEGSFKKGAPHGPNRHWFENGVLASEVNFKEGVPEGIGRQWDKTGKLLVSFEIKNGTGVQKHSSEEQGLWSETSWVKGTWTGRQRTYDKEGVIGDTYWIKNRKVSKKKYIEACKTDPTLPRYDDIKPKKKLPVTKKNPESDNDDFCEKILSSGKAKEAREWFESGNCFLGEDSDEQDSVKFIESLYKAGAHKVWVFDINTDESSGQQYSGRLIIEMPEKPQKRKKIFSICDEIAEDLGFNAENDCGQRYRLLMLD